MRITVLIFALLLALGGVAQPASDIYLFDLVLKPDKISIVNGRNITHRMGYDNQPFFHPNQSILYFTSADTMGRTDLFSFNYTAAETRQLTSTTDREYSPTVTPDQKYISCIIQHDDGAQDLGKYPIRGGIPIVLVNTLTIGYHTWMDNNTLLLFVLGEPNTLHKYTLTDNKDTVVGDRIGRSLHRVPDSPASSFVHKIGPDEWLIKTIDPAGQITTVGKTLIHQEDLAWTPDRRIIMSDGEKMFFLLPSGKAQWTEIALESTVALKGITRISINASGDKIAIVANE